VKSGFKVSPAAAAGELGRSMTMDATYFDTFLRAVENAADQEGILGEEYLIYPPTPDYGYEATPRNALIFGTMGVDGVHYAILRIDGQVTDESPVIHVGPMDFSQPYVVLGATFVSYLADACAVSVREMEAMFAEERAGRQTLVPFLREHFVHSRLYDDERFRKLERYLQFVEPNC
jgi:hypothetical protein